ncbi:SGM_3592 family protein [Streptomyces qinglanensis]|uniref:SGM_3592 family protein n=1 Tax=Streptomyces qinglanensis TaxID=943816 RepID=UPI0037AC8AE5
MSNGGSRAGEPEGDHGGGPDPRNRAGDEADPRADAPHPSQESQEPEPSERPEQYGADEEAGESEQPEGLGRTELTNEEVESVEFGEAFIRAADVTEPAARTRELAARWDREGYPEREPWRSDEPPAGWFWSRSRRSGRERRRGRRRWPWRRRRED